MSAIKDLVVNSASGTVTITIGRRWTSTRAEVTDLPDDAREALLAWLGEKAAEAWTEGFKVGCEAEKQGWSQHGFKDDRVANPYRRQP